MHDTFIRETTKPADVHENIDPRKLLNAIRYPQNWPLQQLYNRHYSLIRRALPIVRWKLQVRLFPLVTMQGSAEYNNYYA